jgi:hypothetical protein
MSRKKNGQFKPWSLMIWLVAYISILQKDGWGMCNTSVWSTNLWHSWQCICQWTPSRSCPTFSPPEVVHVDMGNGIGIVQVQISGWLGTIYGQDEFVRESRRMTMWQSRSSLVSTCNIIPSSSFKLYFGACKMQRRMKKRASLHIAMLSFPSYLVKVERNSWHPSACIRT